MPLKTLMFIHYVAALAIHALYMISERAAVCACAGVGVCFM